MDGSDEIIDLLGQISRRLDEIEAKLDDLSDSASALETSGSLMADDLAEIRRDIDRLEPGVI
jgi:uncharacterized coiled-coil DUF342 family protein